MLRFSATSTSPVRRLRSRAGTTIFEVAVAVACLALVIVSSTQAMLFSNRQATVARLATAARAIVQRNIDEALSVSFQNNTVPANVPAILGVTTASGVVYDDDGGTSGVVNISVLEDGTTVHTSGTMTRIVSAVANSDGADIRQVTFRLVYSFRGRNYTTEMTTLRAADD